MQVDRRRGIVRDEAAVIAKWGVAPGSIADYLAVVGDTADGYPGLPGWGEKAASAILARFFHLEEVPLDTAVWPAGVRGAGRLQAVLRERWDEALLYRTLATLRRDIALFASVDELEWRGPAQGFEQYAERLGARGLYDRAKAPRPDSASSGG